MLKQNKTQYELNYNFSVILLKINYQNNDLKLILLTFFFHHTEYIKRPIFTLNITQMRFIHQQEEAN